MTGRQASAVVENKISLVKELMKRAKKADDLTEQEKLSSGLQWLGEVRREFNKLDSTVESVEKPEPKPRRKPASE